MYDEKPVIQSFIENYEIKSTEVSEESRSKGDGHTIWAIVLGTVGIGFWGFAGYHGVKAARYHGKTLEKRK
ncbi:hypothetical protein [Entomospira culicis]|uniref:Uncharacterized protein n=1 Tax=Entomospira culicis TaxID=2719989 RepID=A0A968GEK4_9SPIO|nr:hypothetical protein [Entomospira culicis]NIZ18946.1 hypothetical protein [Entomospira culicis]NIZ69161.1 hypothetical protein [Entomospira culicis]WDI37748.1 hypothetical protein PVA46_02900 [Entomospira culicis]WDI39376.1 hypothetical protein PVA47_02905 [Entomospira culicis]